MSLPMATLSGIPLGRDDSPQIGHADRETTSVYALVASAESANEGVATKHRTADNEMSNEPNYKQGKLSTQ
jgi:hypothetical protein